MAQIAAEEMGVDFSNVRVVASDTGTVPFDRSTGASRSTTLMGRVIVEACRDAITQMLEMAAELWNTSIDELTEEVGGVQYNKETLSWGQILEKYSKMSGFSIVGRGYLYQKGDLAQLPYGAKGGGEGALNPIPASLANALYRATGVRVREVPLTPERVWRALQEVKNKKS